MSAPSGQSIRRDNHYLPQTYLKRWASPDQKVWVYRTLVSHDSVHTWRPHSVKGIAYHQHLYCRTAHGAESDDVEWWFADNVDGPSEVALAKVAAEAKLTPGDWDVLLRFFAASWCRTPAFYLRRQQAWDKELRARIEQVLQNAATAVEEGSVAAVASPVEGPGVEGAEVPSRVRVRKNPTGEGSVIEAEVLAGRGLWYFEIRRVVEHTWKVLRKLHWTILRPPAGRLWLTSDDPAVAAHISADRKVTFNGGWRTPGSVLLLPLDPEHVLYGKLERPLPLKYAEASGPDAEFIQNCTARHSHRMVFGREKDDWVQTVRPRRVDRDAYEHERNEWRKWHPSQTKAEEDLEDDSTWHVPSGGPW